MDFMDAVELINDLTEHRFGSGPLSDMDANGVKLRKKAFKLAVKANTSGAWTASLAEAKVALAV